MARVYLSTRKKDATLRDRVGAKLSKKSQYEDFLRLLSDDNLWSLMQIPFSPELAELTQQVARHDKPAVAEPTQAFHQEAAAKTEASKE